MSPQYMRDMADVLKTKLPDHHGFLLLSFPFDSPGHCQYISNAVREDALKTLKEFLFRMGEDANWMKDIK